MARRLKRFLWRFTHVPDAPLAGTQGQWAFNDATQSGHILTIGF
jgi:hypothetical protein